MGNYVATIFFREKTSRKSYIIFFCHISFSHSLTISTALSTYYECLIKEACSLIKISKILPPDQAYLALLVYYFLNI